ncbi:MAG: hypothetical protein E6713_07485 [Sporomusaceae bacterium]|nr:hypothetical protein [Sporomusaceae bacterium]
MKLIRRAIDESPAVIVLGNGRILLFSRLMASEYYWRYVFPESFLEMPEYALCFFDVPNVAGFAVLVNGEVKGIDQVDCKSVSVLYIPLKPGVLPRGFRYVLQPERMDRGFQEWSPLHKLLLIEDYPWGQLSNMAGLEQTAKQLRVSGTVISASVALLKDYRRYGSTDISDEAASFARVRKEYIKNSIATDVELINTEQPIESQIACLIKEKIMYTQGIITAYTEQLILKRMRFEKWFDSEWQTVELALLDPDFNGVFRYERVFTTRYFGHIWEERCREFLAHTIYPRMKILLDEYVGSLIKENELDDIYRSIESSLKMKLDIFLAHTPVIVKDEIDYRLLSQSMRLEITEEIQEFVGGDLRNIIGEYITNKFKKWFFLWEKGVSDTVNE